MKFNVNHLLSHKREELWLKWYAFLIYVVIYAILCKLNGRQWIKLYDHNFHLLGAESGLYMYRLFFLLIFQNFDYFLKYFLFKYILK